MIEFGQNLTKKEIPKIPLNMAWEREFPGLTNGQYHAMPELSSSDIKVARGCGYDFKSFVLCKSTAPKKESESFDLGTCAHSCFLENDYSGFVGRPDFKQILGETKDGKPKVIKTIKAQVEEFEAAHRGKIILTPDQHYNLSGMMERIKDSRAMEYLNDSEVEKSFKYMDAHTKLRCKFRPDILRRRQRQIVDYKSASDVSPYGFAKAVARFGYHISAAHYATGFERLWGEPIDSFIFIVQKNTYPWNVAIYKMRKVDLDKSFEMRAALMDRIAKWTDANIYPDYCDENINLYIPGYAFEMKESA